VRGAADRADRESREEARRERDAAAALAASTAQSAAQSAATAVGSTVVSAVRSAVWQATLEMTDGQRLPHWLFLVPARGSFAERRFRLWFVGEELLPSASEAAVAEARGERGTRLVLSDESRELAVEREWVGFARLAALCALVAASAAPFVPDLAPVAEHVFGARHMQRAEVLRGLEVMRRESEAALRGANGAAAVAATTPQPSIPSLDAAMHELRRGSELAAFVQRHVGE